MKKHIYFLTCLFFYTLSTMQYTPLLQTPDKLSSNEKAPNWGP